MKNSQAKQSSTKGTKKAAPKKSKKVPPRKTPQRDARYMGLALIHAAFSKDPNTQIGAVVIDADNDPQGTGYNGPPSEIPDDSFDWKRPDKYDNVIHAEENAIDHSKGSLKGSTLYVTGMPCKRCMLRIINKKIKRVVYLDTPVPEGSSLNTDRKESLDIAKRGKLKLEKFKGDLTWVADWITNLQKLNILPSSTI
jgi:dCMP deaminase